MATPRFPSVKRPAIHGIPGIFPLIPALPLLVCLALPAQASWLIDAERFHASAHGRTSCRECHEDLFGNRPHPEPGNVNRTLEDLFRVENCEGCHADVLDEIDAGAHGGLTEMPREELTRCTRCHDPHYAMTAAARESGIDLAGPAEKKCACCHEYRDVLPGPSQEEQGCMGCHLEPAAGDPGAAQRIAGLCFHCHGTKEGEERPSALRSGLARIDVQAYASTPHRDLSCLSCHPDSARYGHADQKQGNCLDCHVRHDEKVAHDAHLRVACQACHLEGVIPLRDAASGGILWRVTRDPGQANLVHHMGWTRDKEACRRCHAGGKSVGAAAMVLPAKGVICMPCHPATLSAGDATTIVALLISLTGFAGLGSVWLSGSLDSGIERREENKFLRVAEGVLRALLSLRIFAIIESLILDGLLQRRLFRQSKTRWAVHALIFLPFVFRFAWGLVGLAASLVVPESDRTWILLDKNHPVNALFFDLTGVVVLPGVGCAVLRRARRPSREPLAGLPRTDWAASCLLAGIVLAGFLLEAMRIAMTGSPAGAGFAFAGYGLSRAFTGLDLTGLYGYVWYGHAILTGAFVAYLPFSRMIHMITAPIALAMRAGSACRER